MNTFYYATIVITALSINACSSGSGGNDTPTTNRFPTHIDQRITSISTDIDKDGSIDQMERFSYDEMDRIKTRTIEYMDSRKDSVTEYIYADNNLIEIKRNSDSNQYLYENGRVVTHLYIDSIDETYNTETNFIYDDSGRLSGVLGETDLYDPNECDVIALEIDLAVSIPGLNLNYSGNRLSTITSDDGSYTATFTFNDKNQFSSLIETYQCEQITGAEAVVGIELPEDFSAESRFTYDDAGRVVLISSREAFYEDENEITYDSAGRPLNYISTYYDGSPSFDERITQTFTYNEQGLLSTLESTTEDNSPGFFFTPNYISTLEYENKRCVVAIGVNPLILATLDTLGTSRTANAQNESLLCAYPLE